MSGENGAAVQARQTRIAEILAPTGATAAAVDELQDAAAMLQALQALFSTAPNLTAGQAAGVVLILDGALNSIQKAAGLL